MTAVGAHEAVCVLSVHIRYADGLVVGGLEEKDLAENRAPLLALFFPQGPNLPQEGRPVGLVVHMVHPAALAGRNDRAIGTLGSRAPGPFVAGVV